VAVSFVAYTGTGGATQVEPTGTAQNDILLAVINATTSPTGPAGWTQVGSIRNASGEYTGVWWIRRGSSAPSYTWTGTIDGGVVAAFRGASNLLSASAQSAAGSAVSPSVTTTFDNSMIVCLYGDAGSSSITAPSGMTLTTGFFNAVAYVLQASAGASGTKTWGGTSLPVGSWTIALEPADKSFTASQSLGLTRTGDLTVVSGVSFTGSQSLSLSQSGAVLGLGAALTGSQSLSLSQAGAALKLDAKLTASQTLGLTGTGNLSVESRLLTGTLEIELTAGVWTDFTSRMDLKSGALVIRQGRPTVYDDVGAGTLTCSLFNDDGEIMPDNPSASFALAEGMRIRWKVTQSATTYTRFVGWISELVPDFPGESTIGARVAVTAVDALGLLGQRKLRSHWTELALATARAAGVQGDALEAAGTAIGWNATMTNYSTDAGATNGGYAYSGSDPNLAFSADRDISIGPVVTSSPSSNGNSNKTLPAVQSGSKCIQWLIKTPTQKPASGTPWFVSSPHPSSSATGFQIALRDNGSGTTNLVVMDVSGSTVTGTLLTGVCLGQWVLLTIKENGSNTSKCDVTATQLGDGTTGTVSSVSFDVKTILIVEFPTSTGSTSAAAFGGVIAFGSRTTALTVADASIAGSQGAVSSRLSEVQSVLSSLPIAWGTSGTFDTQCVTGTWSNRTALEVLQELMRTNLLSVAWARSRDSTIYTLGYDVVRPASSLVTIDSDGDCLGPPRLSRQTSARPTRVQIDAPGLSIVRVDATAEAALGSPQRLRSYTTVCANDGDMATIGDAVLAQRQRLRITQLQVDLTTGATDHTATLFDESGALSGLFPTCRATVTVPASHFGSSSLDYYVQGWTETYSSQRAVVTLDTDPCPA